MAPPVKSGLGAGWGSGPLPRIGSIVGLLAPNGLGSSIFRRLFAPPKVSVLTLAVAEAVTAMTSTTTPVVQQHALTVAASTRAQVAQAPTLTQVQALAASAAAQARTTGTVALTQVQALTPAAGSSTTSSAFTAVTQIVADAVAGATSDTSASTLGLTQRHVVDVGGTAGASSASTVVLQRIHAVTVPGDTVAAAGGQVVLQQSHGLTLAWPGQIAAAGTLAVQQVHALSAPVNAVESANASSGSITQAQVLEVPAGTTLTSSTGAPLLQTGNTATLGGSTGSTSTGVTLVQVAVLSGHVEKTPGLPFQDTVELFDLPTTGDYIEITQAQAVAPVGGVVSSSTSGPDVSVAITLVVEGTQSGGGGQTVVQVAVPAASSIGTAASTVSLPQEPSTPTGGSTRRAHAAVDDTDDAEDIIAIIGLLSQLELV